MGKAFRKKSLGKKKEDDNRPLSMEEGDSEVVFRKGGGTR